MKKYSSSRARRNLSLQRWNSMSKIGDSLESMTQEQPNIQPSSQQPLKIQQEILPYSAGRRIWLGIAKALGTMALAGSVLWVGGSAIKQVQRNMV